jgi:hypothetical protein
MLDEENIAKQKEIAANQKKIDAHKKELEKLNKRQEDYENYRDSRLKGATFIRVPYDEKLLAKSMGAMWHPEYKLWFIPPNVKRDPFLKKWGTVYKSNTCKVCHKGLTCDHHSGTCEYTMAGVCCPFDDEEACQFRYQSSSENLEEPGISATTSANTVEP